MEHLFERADYEKYKNKIDKEEFEFVLEADPKGLPWVINNYLKLPIDNRKDYFKRIKRQIFSDLTKWYEIIKSDRYLNSGQIESKDINVQLKKSEGSNVFEKLHNFINSLESSPGKADIEVNENEYRTLYHNNEWILVKVFTHKASVFFGRNKCSGSTCVSRPDDINYFKLHTVQSNLYYLRHLPFDEIGLCLNPEFEQGEAEEILDNEQQERDDLDEDDNEELEESIGTEEKPEAPKISISEELVNGEYSDLQNKHSNFSGNAGSTEGVVWGIEQESKWFTKNTIIKMPLQLITLIDNLSGDSILHYLYDTVDDIEEYTSEVSSMIEKEKKLFDRKISDGFNEDFINMLVLEAPVKFPDDVIRKFFYLAGDTYDIHIVNFIDSYSSVLPMDIIDNSLTKTIDKGIAWNRVIEFVDKIYKYLGEDKAVQFFKENVDKYIKHSDVGSFKILTSFIKEIVYRNLSNKTFYISYILDNSPYPKEFISDDITTLLTLVPEEIANIIKKNKLRLGHKEVYALYNSNNTLIFKEMIPFFDFSNQEVQDQLVWLYIRELENSENSKLFENIFSKYKIKPSLVVQQTFFKKGGFLSKLIRLYEIGMYSSKKDIENFIAGFYLSNKGYFIKEEDLVPEKDFLFVEKLMAKAASTFFSITEIFYHIKNMESIERPDSKLILVIIKGLYEGCKQKEELIKDIEKTNNPKYFDILSKITSIDFVSQKQQEAIRRILRRFK